ncbi:hypothetical protein KCP73_23865 [Salmonella enterica subsp. enterica]|nr:hypothetical protein KCP73_23865 [Salmonella enterica subsp. enterica]
MGPNGQCPATTLKPIPIRIRKRRLHGRLIKFRMVAVMLCISSPSINRHPLLLASATGVIP